MLLLRLVSRAFYTDLIDFGVNAELSYRGPALLDERIRFLRELYALHRKYRDRRDPAGDAYLLRLTLTPTAEGKPRRS